MLNHLLALKQSQRQIDKNHKEKTFDFVFGFLFYPSHL